MSRDRRHLYRQRSADLPLQLPTVPDGVEPPPGTFYVVRTDADGGATTSIAGLTERGIGTSVHFIPLHLHSYYRYDLRLPARRLPCGRARSSSGRLAADLERDDRRTTSSGSSTPSGARLRPGRAHGDRVAITGGFGFLGWHLACRLRALRLSRSPRGSAAASSPTPTAPACLARRCRHGLPPGRGQPSRHRRRGRARQRRARRHACRRRPRQRSAGARGLRQLDAVTAGQPLRPRQARGRRDPRCRSGRRRGHARRRPACPTCSASTDGRRTTRSWRRSATRSRTAGPRPSAATGAVPLLHAQDAARGADRRGRSSRGPRSCARGHRARGLRRTGPACRATTAVRPRRAARPLDDPFAVDLFNTYRSYVFPHQFPFHRRGARATLVATCSRRSGPTAAPARPLSPRQSRGHPGRPLPPAQGRAVLRGQGRGRDRAAPTAHDEVVRFRLSGDRARLRGHAHDVGAQHHQRGRGRPGHDVLGRPAAGPGAARTSTRSEVELPA